MNKRLVILALSCFFCLASQGQADLPKGKSVKLGAIVSLTGPAAEQGQNWLSGARLAVSELKQNHGINVELVVEDDATRPAAVVSAFDKLVTVDSVSGIIGGTWDFLAEAAAPSVRRYKVPFITPTNPVEVFSPSVKENKQFFTAGLSIKATVESVAEVLAKLQPKRLALVVPNLPFGLLHADAIEELAKQSNIQVTSRTNFEMAGYSDTLRTLAARIARDNPQVVFCLTDHVGLSAFVKEVRRLQYDGWILTTQHLEAAIKLSNQPNQWSKVIGFYPEVRDQSFAERYNKHYGEEPKVFAAEGYDALLFLASAIAEGIDLSAKPFEVQGVTGKLRSEPGVTEISSLAAVALRLGQGGLLETFRPSGQSQEKPYR